MKFYLALLLLLYCVTSIRCDEEKEAILAENEDEMAEKEEQEPVDHTAFLQIDDSADLQIQNSKPSRIKMRKLIKEIDNDKDGKLSEKELTDWMKRVINKHVVDEGKKQMPKIDQDGDDHATWEEYKKAAGYSEGDKVEPRTSSETSKQRDKEKFNLADVDGDEKLSYYELGIMIHPNEDQRTSFVVVNEFLTGMDKNKDGKLSSKEFSGGAKIDEIDESFNKIDANKDGFLDSKELREWLTPENKDLFLFEAEGLIEGIDDDKDGFLTEKEIFKHYARFATSRATKYGRLLVPDGDLEDKKQAKKTKKEQSEKLEL